jgi:hypothetical protein
VLIRHLRRRGRLLQWGDAADAENTKEKAPGKVSRRIPKQGLAQLQE